MTFLKFRVLIVACVILMSAILIAQDPAEDEPVPEPAPVKKKVVEPEKPRYISRLPKPLPDIQTNILDLEREGFLAIDAVDFRTRATGDEAIVWSVRVKKAIT